MCNKTVVQTFLKDTVFFIKRTVTSKKMRKGDFVRAVGPLEMGLSVMPESYTTLQNMSVFHEPLRGNLVDFT